MSTTSTETADDLLRPYVPRLVSRFDTLDAPMHERLTGSLAFVDISGFTALSERLASHGRVGAEVITSTMTAAFTELLTTADAFGGDLLKFGGDALLLLFTGSDHLQRSAAAVATMHSDLERVGKIETEGGRVDLGMSAGIATGSIDVFCVGELHRELIFTGPVADELAAAEAAASRGQTGIAGAATSLLPDDWLRHDGDQVLLAHNQAVARRPERRGSEPSARWADFVPTALRGSVGRLQDAGEHRTACIAFAKITGLNDAMADSVERAAESLHCVVSAIDEEADRHGVTFLATDLTSDGTKAILAAGVPVSHGDSVERTLRTARAVVARALPLPVRFGVNAGHLFAGDVGAPFRRTYTVMGDTVNLAARLVERSDYGEVLAATAAIDRARSHFPTRSVEPFLVKGKTEPIKAAYVDDPSDEIEVRTDVPLVGRDAELELFLIAIENARAGRGSAIEVIAEPGMGKSRLLQEVRSRNEDLRTLTVASDEYTTATPFVAIRRLLRAVLDIAQDAPDVEAGVALHARLRTEPDLQPWAPLIGIALDAAVDTTPEVDRLDPKFRSQQLGWAISELLFRRMSEPTHLIFEDAHWMDNASADVVVLLVERSAAMPWMITSTRRPRNDGFTMPDDGSATSMALQPLDADAARELVKQAASERGILDSDLDRLTSQAEGHPMFLLELVSSLDTSDQEELPGSIEGLIAQRIDRLDPVDRHHLRALAVLGRRFSREIADDALGDLPGAAAEALDRFGQFIEPIDASDLQFRHAIVRDAAYAGLSYRQRRSIHLKVAQALESLEDPPEETIELLSLHSFEGGDYGPAWRYAKAAGDHAADRFASADAVRLYRRALEASARVDDLNDSEVADVAERLGDVCDLAGLFEEGRAAFARARRLSKEPVVATRLMMKRGLMDERMGRYPQALRMLRRALTESDTISDEHVRRIRVEIRVAYAGVRFRQGRYRECIRWCRDAIERAPSLGQQRELAHAYYLLDHSLGLLGEKQDDRYAERAIAIFEELGDYLRLANVLNNLGVEAYNDGRWADSLDLQSRHREARQRAGDAVGASIAAYNVGLIQSDQGHHDEARASFEETLRTCRAAGYLAGVAAATAGLGHLESMSGDTASGLSLLNEALELFRDLGADYFEADVRLRIAEAHLVAGDLEQAEATAESAAGFLSALEGVDATMAGLQRMLGYCRLATDAGSAQSHFIDALRLARSDDAAYEVLLALEALVRSGYDSTEIEGWRSELQALQEQLGVLSTPSFDPT